MQSSPLPCYHGSLTPKFSPQHPIFKHPGPTFLPYCERPCFITIHNNRQYISIFIFLDFRLEDKIFYTEW
jgi:hypothetical protein